jgi:tRNA(Ile)-lysidine synthase
LGIDPDRLGTTAVLLRWASEALGHWAADVAGRIAEETTAGDVSLALDAFVQLPYETHLRLATTAIRWVSSSPYRPRLQALQPGLAAAAVGRRATLGGALLGRVGKGDGRRVVIGREPRAAARAPAMPTTAIWDGRWQVSGPHAPDLQVRMLGEAGLSLCPDWRSTGLSRASLIASPAVWRGEALVAAPLAGRAEGWTAKVVPSFLSVLRGSR